MKKWHRFKRWASLLFGIVIIWVLASVIAPITNAYIPGIDRLISVTEINNIDPGEFWYMDVDVNDKASAFISDCMDSTLSDQ